MHGEHFSEQELACHHCGRNECTQELVDALEAFRAAAGNVPVIVDDAYRCAEHNRAIGGVPNSRHVLGQAADIRITGLTGRQLYAIARQVPAIHGIGVNDYEEYIHVDVRPVPARWCYEKSGRQTAWYEAPPASPAGEAA